MTLMFIQNIVTEWSDKYSFKYSMDMWEYLSECKRCSAFNIYIEKNSVNQ